MAIKILSDEKLEEKLLFKGKSKRDKRPKAKMEVNYLPDLYRSIKQQMPLSEQSSINDFEFQNFLMEMHFHEAQKHKDIFTLKNYILEHVRSSPKYWIYQTESYEKAYKIEQDILQQIEILKKQNTEIQKQFQQDNVKISEENQVIGQCFNQMNEENQKKINQQQLNNSIDIYNSYQNRIQQILAKFNLEFNDKTNFKQKNSQKIQVSSDQIIKNEEDQQLDLINEKQEEQTNLETQELKSSLINCLGENLDSKRKITRKLANEVFLKMGLNSNQIIKSEIFCNRSIELLSFSQIFNVNHNKRKYCIPLILFPILFQFTKQIYQPLSQLNQIKFNFRLQNFIFYMFTQQSNKENQKFKIKSDQLDKLYTLKEKELELFDEFCINNFSFSLNQVIFSDISQKKIFFSILQNSIKILTCYILINYPQKDYYTQEQMLYITNIINGNAAENLLNQFQQLLRNLSLYEKPLNCSEMFYQLQNGTLIIENLNKLKNLIWFYINEVELQQNNIKQDLNLFLKMQFLNIDQQNQVKISIDNFQKFHQSELMIKKRAYQFHTQKLVNWKEDEFKKFLSALLKYYNYPINNFKISKEMGPHIRSNHVRYIKNKYLKYLKKQAKQRKQIAKDILIEHIQNFDMSIFTNNLQINCQSINL